MTIETEATVNRFYNSDNSFYFEASEYWRTSYDPEQWNIVQVATLDDSISLTASGYGLWDGYGLREFADN